MKKLVALALAILMFFCVGCAWADGEETAEITFQGCSWGSSAEDTANWLLGEGIVTNEYSILYKGSALLQDCWIPQVYMNEDGSVPAENAYPHAIKMLVANEFLNPEFKIAGYSLENLYMCFACEGDSTQLISVVIEFRAPEGDDAAFADLQQKLHTVYGEGDENDEMHYLKFGADNTAVHLFREQVWGTNKPMLMYGNTAATSIPDAQGAPASSIDSTDTSGL